MGSNVHAHKALPLPGQEIKLSVIRANVIDDHLLEALTERLLPVFNSFHP